MKKLLETLDSKIFTPELIAQIVEMHEKAVNDEVNMKTKIFKDHIIEKAKEYTKLVEEKLQTKLLQYADRVVEAFVTENEEKIQTKINESELTALLEGFNSMMITGGVYLKDINEARDESPLKSENEALKVQLDELIEENTGLTAVSSKLMKENIFKAVTTDLNVGQIEQVKKLAKLVEFDVEKYKEYESKLTVLKENVLETPTVKKVVKKAKVNESHDRFFN